MGVESREETNKHTQKTSQRLLETIHFGQLRANQLVIVGLMDDIDYGFETVLRFALGVCDTSQLLSRLQSRIGQQWDFLGIIENPMSLCHSEMIRRAQVCLFGTFEDAGLAMQGFMLKGIMTSRRAAIGVSDRGNHHVNGFLLVVVLGETGNSGIVALTQMLTAGFSVFATTRPHLVDARR